MRAPTKKILIVNSKGGCGKTTVAVNLAVAYANQGLKVSLLDCDQQTSCLHWAEERDYQAPNINSVACFHSLRPLTETLDEEIANDCEIVILDVSAKQPAANLFEESLKASDMVLIPVLASSLDVKAGERFITDLLTHRVMRATPKPVGVIYNRTKASSNSHKRLEDLLRCLDIPVITALEDASIYTTAMEIGSGVLELSEDPSARSEYSAWREIMLWIDRKSKGKRDTPRPLQAGKTSDNRKPSAYIGH
jgi:chromosome partitioning protein